MQIVDMTIKKVKKETIFSLSAGEIWTHTYGIVLGCWMWQRSTDMQLNF